MDQAIDEGDHAAGIGEDLIPFAEHFVGGQGNGTLLLITAGDHLEEQIGIVCVVGEIADLVNGKQAWAGVAVHAASERGGGSYGRGYRPRRSSAMRRPRRNHTAAFKAKV